MAEIEFSVLTRDCPRGRRGDEPKSAAYEARRNAAQTTADWRFSIRDARAKLRRLYPCNF